MRNFASPLLVACLGAVAGVAQALPIGFGLNQGSLEYDERKSENFHVYHDRRVPSEGARNLHALEYARPLIERWFDASRKRPLPVVTSAVTSNASFANFIADAIEVQTLGQADKELAWHEYTHSMMYRKLDNWFGPAGAILHLLWMPAWFLEGLAESTSVSVGSDVQAGIERYQALTGDWPTYDRLHSLYSKAGFAERGYATAGALVAYLLKKGDPNKLPAMLDDFYRYSMPWYWPWAAVPFNGFMPMDAALESNFKDLAGEALYEQYKKDATAFWKSRDDDPFLLKQPGTRIAMSTARGLRSDGKRILNLQRGDDDRTYESELIFDEKTGWYTSSKKAFRAPEGFDTFARVHSKELSVAADESGSDVREPTTKLKIQTRAGGKKRTFHLVRPGSVVEVFETPKALGWMEWYLATTRVCLTPKPLTSAKAAKAATTCVAEEHMPRKLRALGTKPTSPGSHLVSEFWYVRADEKRQGVVHDVRILDAATGAVRDAGIRSAAKPLGVAFAGGETWILMAERWRRTLRRYDASGVCQAMITVKDHLMDVKGLANGDLVVSVYDGDGTQAYRMTKAQRREKPCAKEEPPTSPLEYALQQKAPVDFKTAMAGADLWAKEPRPLPAAVESELFATPSLDEDRPGAGKVETASKPAKWRPRALFLFPWIGADDAMGSQIGVVSVPLTDELQNESARATFLYGVASRFPYQELALISTRFTPTYSLSFYRSQKYNGRFLNEEREFEYLYYDEKGGRLEMDLDFRGLGGDGSLGLGVKFAHLKPYIGPTGVRRGFLTEPAGSLYFSWLVGDLSISHGYSGRVAPEELNDENFDYNQLGSSLTLGHPLPFLRSRLSLGLEGSRTRGKKRLFFQEMYVPLKTFIPGSGGGYNQNSFPLVDADGLFSPLFGDTQGRAKATYTFPLLPDIDKQIFIVYLERLDFTAFYNYGGAWRGPEPSVGWDKLVRAHGYNVDLQLENKGVRFNAGLGTGQVIGRDFEVYITSGFDALF